MNCDSNQTWYLVLFLLTQRKMKTDKKIQTILFSVIILFIIVFLLIVILTVNDNSSGKNITDNSNQTNKIDDVFLKSSGSYPQNIDFTDFLRVPNEIPIYLIRQNESEYLTLSNMVAIASHLNFTSQAESTPTSTGYSYTEQSKQLTFSLTPSQIQFEQRYADINQITNSVPITLPNALQKAKELLDKIGLRSSSYLLNEAATSIWEIDTYGIANETGILPNKGFYRIPLKLRFLNTYLYSKQDAYIDVSTIGDIIGFNIWIPEVDITSESNKETISFTNAIQNINDQNSILLSVKPIPNSVTFVNSDLGYYVPDRYFETSSADSFELIPIYIFTNEARDITLYVPAVEL